MAVRHYPVWCILHQTGNGGTGVSTPTRADVDPSALTELRPGVYVFNDAKQPHQCDALHHGSVVLADKVLDAPLVLDDPLVLYAPLDAPLTRPLATRVLVLSVQVSR